MRSLHASVPYLLGSAAQQHGKVIRTENTTAMRHTSYYTIHTLPLYVVVMKIEWHMYSEKKNVFGVVMYLPTHKDMPRLSCFSASDGTVSVLCSRIERAPVE